LADQVTALIVLITASSLAVSTVNNGDNFDIVGATGQDLNVIYSGTGTAAGAATISTPAVTYADGILAIVNDDADWYGLVIESIRSWDILSTAGYMETTQRLFLAKSADADILTTATDDIMSTLKALGYNKTALIYHSSASEFPDVALMANRLAVDPDQASTVWANVTLVGVTPQDAFVNSTEKANLLAKNANVYLTLKGVGSTGNGKVASGEWIDVVLEADWFAARVAERAASVLLDYSNRGEKVPYDNDGIDIFAGVVRGVQRDGERIGHFIKDASVIDAPELSEVSAADRQARKLTIKYSMEPSGAILFVTITGTLAISA